MRLTRKKAIELCIELWEWLAKTGKIKSEWPEWVKYENIECDCWFCEYQVRQEMRYPTANHYGKNGTCRYCPLTTINVACEQDGTLYRKWDASITPQNRKKYAKLFLEQIRSIAKE